MIKFPLEVEDLFSCNLCDYDTFDQNELNMHERIIHGKKTPRNITGSSA